ncbi:MAG: prenyltransferase [Bacteroidales bacterium]|nr:prenyltransferase [Bacteroidales bacterium]
MNRVKFWFKNSRYISLPQSITPAVLAVAMTFGCESFSWWLSLVAVLGVVFAHLGMNLADDYFDYKLDTTRIRQQVASEGIKTHLEKCHYILSGEATTRQLAIAFSCFLLLAGLAGLVVFLFRGWSVMLVALGGLLLGLSYSGGPLKLGYRGFGEITIGLMFGPLLMVGMSLAAIGEARFDVLLVSFAEGLLVTNIGYVHSVMDIRTDTLSNRKSFAVLLNNKRAMLVALGVFAFLPFVIVIAGVAAGILHWSSLFVLALVPLSVYLIYSAHCFVYEIDIPIVPKWWMGPMGDFESYRKADMDWFLLRWLVARNIVMFFSLILTICSVVAYFIA